MVGTSYTCVICGSRQEGYSNNAQPIMRGKCCDECNETKVIPARLKEIRSKQK